MKTMVTIKEVLAHHESLLKKISVVLTIIIGCGLLLVGQRSSFAYFADPSATCAGVTEIPESECQALVSIYNTTQGDKWTDKSNWGNTGSICSNRYGVYCKDSHVYLLNLGLNKLVGTLPSLAGLPYLEYLEFGTNSITSIADNAFTGLDLLTYIGLASNRLTTLPEDIIDIPNLIEGNGISIDNNYINYNNLSVDMLAFLDAKNYNTGWRDTQMFCGNGTTDSGETCDDGNTEDGDGCDSTCQTEVPSEICGNTIVEGSEACDDGNTEDGDGCDSTCQWEEIPETCGNGTIDDDEECDDGNTTDGDLCSSTCQSEADSSYDLQISSNLIDSYINSGSLFRYQISYFNNSDTAKDNVTISFDGSPFTLLRGNSEGYDDTQSAHNTRFGDDEDECMDDLLNETGTYMELLNQWANGLVEGTDIYDLITIYPSFSEAFSQEPYNNEYAQVGEFLNTMVESTYPKGLHGYLYSFFSMLNIDLIDYPECGSLPATTYTWDVGTVGARSGGSIILRIQNIWERFIDSIDVDTLDDISGEVVTENIFSLPTEVSTQESDLGFSLKNESQTGTTSVFLNKTGGPLLFNNDYIIASIIEEGMTEQEKAIAVWKLVKENVFNYPNIDRVERHSEKGLSAQELINPVLFLNTLYGVCSEINGTMAALDEMIGLDARLVSLNGHIVAEINIDDQWGLMDADGGVYWTGEDGHILSMDEILADPDIISNNPQNNSYDTDGYIEMITSTGDNDTTDFDYEIDSTPTMLFSLYPQDTVDYDYTYLFTKERGDDGQVNHGGGTLTRHLSSYHNITSQTENSFTYGEAFPYLIYKLAITSTNNQQGNVGVYITVGDRSEVFVGDLYGTLTYTTNKPERLHNYYDYSLRFVCEEACDIDELISNISISNTFLFNSNVLPYNGDISAYLINPDDGFEGISVKGNYNLDNKFITTVTISGSNELNTRNNSYDLKIGTQNNDYVVLTETAYQGQMFSLEGYTTGDESSLFSEYSGAYFGKKTMSLQNISTIGPDVIITSEDDTIQALLPEDTDVDFDGTVCRGNLLSAPILIDDSFAEGVFATGTATTVFKVGSPCTGTSLTFSNNVSIKVAMEGAGTVTIKTSEDGEEWTDLGTGTIEDGVLTFSTDHFSYFALDGEIDDGSDDSGDDSGDDDVLPSPSGSPQIKDVCPNGDYSESYYDGSCTSYSEASCSLYSDELNAAYQYARTNDITTIDDCKEADLYGTVLRVHMAKMISNFALNVLKKTPDTTRNCVFSDMDNQSEEMQEYAITACQLGLMGLKSDGSEDIIFNPNGKVTRAEFGTILSRLLRGDLYNGGEIYYKKHLDALKEAGIMNKIDYPLAKELRGWVMLMMMRIAN